jgi:periplasmic copper chaperone A
MRALALAVALGIIGGGGVAFARSNALSQNNNIRDIEVAYPWAPATDGSQLTNSAAFMNLTDHGAAPDELISASSPVAQNVQLHVFDVENGVYGMHRVNAIEVAPGAVATVLRPGGAHVMLEGLKQPLQVGETFPLSLTFKHAGEIRVEVRVVSPKSVIAGAAWTDSLQSLAVHGGLQ